MAEYIEREALLKAYLSLSLAKSKAAKARKGVAFFQGELYPMIEITEKEWIRLINAAPAADVVEVVHGRWVFGGDGIVECTRCNETYDANMLPRNYCPNCGARMDGDG